MRSISIFSALLPIVFYFLFLKRNKGGRLWVIPIYTATSFFTDWIIRWSQGQIPYNKGLIFLASTLYSFVEGAMFLIFLLPLLKTKNFRTITIVLAFLNLVYGAGTLISSPDLSVDYYNMGFVAIEEASIIILCMFYYYEQLNNREVTFIYDLKEFWIITAFFSVTVSTLFLVISASILGASMGDYWFISQVATILKYILLIVGLMRRPALRSLR